MGTFNRLGVEGTADLYCSYNPDTHDQDVAELSTAIRTYVREANYLDAHREYNATTERHQTLIDRAASVIERLTNCAAHVVCHNLL